MIGKVYEPKKRRRGWGGTKANAVGGGGDESESLRVPVVRKTGIWGKQRDGKLPHLKDTVLK